jgi:hypothetical protein
MIENNSLWAFYIEKNSSKPHIVHKDDTHMHANAPQSHTHHTHMHIDASENTNTDTNIILDVETMKSVRMPLEVDLFIKMPFYVPDFTSLSLPNSTYMLYKLLRRSNMHDMFAQNTLKSRYQRKCGSDKLLVLA